jgi:hypothetical protein
MSRRIIILALVCAAIGFLFWWLLQNSEWVELKVPGTLSGQAAEDPFYAATRLVERLGARSQSLRSLLAPPPPDAVLVITNWNWSAPKQQVNLQQWVAEGGRLVIDSSVGSMAQVQAWTHLRLTYPFVRGREDTTPEDPQALLERIKPCRAMHVVPPTSDETAPPPYWHLCGLNPIRRLVAARGIAWGVGDDHGLQAVRLPIGKGAVFFADGLPFTQQTLIEQDNARLFVSALQLRRGDLVYFLHSAAPESLLYLLWREAAAALCLLLLAAAAYAWRSATRLAPLLPVPDPARRSLIEQIRGTANFLRYGGDAALLHAATLSSLEAAGQRKLAGYGRLAAEERLQLIARRTGLDPERLRSARSWRDSRSAEGLSESILLLEAARRRLTTGLIS